MLLNEKLTKWRNEYIIKFEDSYASEVKYSNYQGFLGDQIMRKIHDESFEYAKAGLLRLG